MSPKPNRWTFSPDAEIPGFTRVRVLGEPFKRFERGVYWQACEFPDRVVRPVRPEWLRPLVVEATA